LLGKEKKKRGGGTESPPSGQVGKGTNEIGISKKRRIKKAEEKEQRRIASHSDAQRPKRFTTARKSIENLGAVAILGDRSLNSNIERERALMRAYYPRLRGEGK